MDFLLPEDLAKAPAAAYYAIALAIVIGLVSWAKRIVPETYHDKFCPLIAIALGIVLALVRMPTVYGVIYGVVIGLVASGLYAANKGE